MSEILYFPELRQDDNVIRKNLKNVQIVVFWSVKPIKVTLIWNDFILTSVQVHASKNNNFYKKKIEMKTAVVFF